ELADDRRARDPEHARAGSLENADEDDVGGAADEREPDEREDVDPQSDDEKAFGVVRIDGTTERQDDEQLGEREGRAEQTLNGPGGPEDIGVQSERDQDGRERL